MRSTANQNRSDFQTFAGLVLVPLALLLAVNAGAAPKPAAPRVPGPPSNSGKFPVQKHKRRQPRVLVLKKGQTRITPEELKNARPLQPESHARPKTTPAKKAAPGKKPAAKKTPAKKTPAAKK